MELSYRTLGLMVALAAFLAAGCGGGSPDSGSENTVSLELADGVRSHGDRSMAVIAVSKRDGQLVYRIHDDPASLSEVMRLAANLASYSPDMPVFLAPGPTLSGDEIAWLQAKLRETGLRNLRVVRSEGDGFSRPSAVAPGETPAETRTATGP